MLINLNLIRREESHILQVIKRDASSRNDLKIAILFARVRAILQSFIIKSDCVLNRN